MKATTTETTETMTMKKRCADEVRNLRAVSRGAALVEFVVLAIIMVPLLFAIPMIGKLIDVEQTAVQASRYAAWETTVGVSAADGNALQGRFFADPAASIATGVGGTGNNPLWGEGLVSRGGHEKNTRIVVMSDGVAAIPHVPARDGRASIAAGVGEAVKEAGNALEKVSSLGAPVDWSLSADGLTVGGVRVGVGRNGLLRNSPSPCAVAGAYACLEELSVIMSDGWSAGDDDQAVERIRSLVPANALREVGDLFSLAGKIPVFKELEGLESAFGHVDVSELPASEDNIRPLERYEEPRP